jgi:DNA primase catalytic subunit
MGKVQNDAAIRTAVYAEVSANGITGFSHVGQTVEGMIFQNAEGKVITLKVIVKKEGFDISDAISEKLTKDAAAKEKAAVAAEKAEERALKATEAEKRKQQAALFAEAARKHKLKKEAEAEAIAKANMAETVATNTVPDDEPVEDQTN